MTTPTRLQIIADLWTDYARIVIPADAPAVQRLETERAFYAGAYGLFTSIINLLDSDREPTERDLRLMDAIARELETYKLSVLAGKN